MNPRSAPETGRPCAVPVNLGGGRPSWLITGGETGVAAGLRRFSASPRHPRPPPPPPRARRRRSGRLCMAAATAAAAAPAAPDGRTGPSMVARWWRAPLAPAYPFRAGGEPQRSRGWRVPTPPPFQPLHAPDPSRPPGSLPLPRATRGRNHRPRRRARRLRCLPAPPLPTAPRPSAASVPVLFCCPVSLVFKSVFRSTMGSANGHTQSSGLLNVTPLSHRSVLTVFSARNLL